MNESPSAAAGAFWGAERVGLMVWVWVTLIAASLAYSGVLWVQARQDRLTSHLMAEETLLGQARVDLAKGYLHVSLGGRPGSPFDRARGLALLGQAHSSLEKALRLQRGFEGGPALRPAGEALPAQLAAFARAVVQFRCLVTSRQEDLAADTALITELRIAFFALERQAEQIDAQIQQDLSGTMRRYSVYQATITGGAGMLLALICLSAFAGDRARKRTEKRRREAEARIRLLFEHSPDGIVVIDPATLRFSEFNETAHQQLGYSREEFGRLCLSDIENGDPSGKTRLRLAEVIGERRGDYETEHRTRLGEARNIHVSAQLTPIQGKSVYHCVWRDVTDRVRAEKSLRESEERYRLVAENGTDVIWLFDLAANRFSYVSPSVVRLRGYTVEEVLQQDMEAALTPASYRMVSGRLPARLAAFAAGDDTVMTQAHEVIQNCKDGSTVATEVVTTLIHDTQRRVTHIQGVTRDITARKHAEDALRASLDEKVALLKEVHHRVKNNLQIVASLLGLQASRSTNEQVVGMLQDTRNRVRSMALLHEMLYRSENLACINFATYLKDLCGQLQLSYRLAAGHIQMEYRIAEVGLSLEQAVPCGLIVSELVSNALKHGFPGDHAGRIVVGLDVTDDRMLIVSVEDDGVGLHPDLNLTTASTLGLKLVAGLAHQLRGQLDIEAARGTGALFRVVFPIPEETHVGRRS